MSKVNSDHKLYCTQSEIKIKIDEGAFSDKKNN